MRGPWDRRLTRRRFMAWSGLTVIAAACGSTASPVPTSSGASASPGSSQPPSAGGVLRYGRAGDITDFNPWDVSSSEFEVYNQVFSRLVWKDSDGKEHLDLAESYQLAPDGKSVEIKVRQGVKWHDGKDFTAQDYVTMFGYLSDPELAEDPNVVELQGLFGVVEAVEAPDPTTLRMRFSDPVPYIVDMLDYWHAIRIDNKADFGFVATPPVGTGPFKLTQVTPSQSLTFEKFEDYYVAGQPAIGQFDIALYGGATNLVQNLQSGSVNGILVANPAEIQAVKGDDRYYLDVVPTGGVWNLYINVRKAPFDKQEVRQALSYSMNRAAMVEAGDFDLEEPVTTPFSDPSTIAYREDLVLAHPFDLDKAKSLLDAAGVSNLKIAYPAPSDIPQAEVYGLIWQADLAKIGVTLDLQKVESARWREIGSGKFPEETDVIFWSNGRGKRDPAIFWSTQNNFGGNGETIWGYKNDEMISLVAQGKAEVDPEKRKQIYQQLNQMLTDSSHVIQISTVSQKWLWSASVKDVGVDLIGALVLPGASVGP